MSEFDDLQFPGEEREQRWLQERLATLSVRESVALTAAMLRTQPRNAVDAINCLQSMDHYTVHRQSHHLPRAVCRSWKGTAVWKIETPHPRSGCHTGSWRSVCRCPSFVGSLYRVY